MPWALSVYLREIQAGVVVVTVLDNNKSAVNHGLGAIDIQALTTPTVSVMFFGFSVSPPIIPASVVLEEVTNCSQS